MRETGKVVEVDLVVDIAPSLIMSYCCLRFRIHKLHIFKFSSHHDQHLEKIFNLIPKGSRPPPKRMNFQKSSKGGGSFSIQKFILQIFAIIDDTLVMNFRKNLQYDFPKNEGGGSKTVWNFSENSSVLEGKGVPNGR